MNNNLNKHGVSYRLNLMNAETIIHEVIHAEIFRKFLSVLNNSGNIVRVTSQDVLDALSTNYPGILYFYGKFKKDWQHAQIADYYRTTIAYALSEFDNNQRPYQFYLDIAWEGLRYPKSVAWSSLSSTEKNRINQVINGYIDANKNQKYQ